MAWWDWFQSRRKIPVMHTSSATFDDGRRRRRVFRFWHRPSALTGKGRKL